MDTLSILPAIDLMRPAAIPFLLTVFLLLTLSRFWQSIPKTWRFTGDLTVVLGILVTYFVFDRPAIIYLFTPSRPMDWIPALVLISFISRHLLKKIPSLLFQLLMITLSTVILLFPLLHQNLTSGFILVAEILGLWLLAQSLTLQNEETGVSRVTLVPIFLTTVTLGALSPLSGSLLLGQLAGGLAAIWLAMILAGPPRVFLSGVEPGIALGSLLLIARQYVDLSFIVVEALYLATLAGVLMDRILSLQVPPRPFLRVFLPTLVTLLFLTGAIVKTLQTSQGAGSGY
ncbi:MAG: hypothetical protein ACP5OP_01180 [Leptospirillia bacterium]